MIEVRELGESEIKELISRVGYCHLACTDGTEPYVVPVHYAFEPPYLYVYTTEKRLRITGTGRALSFKARLSNLRMNLSGQRHWKPF